MNLAFTDLSCSLRPKSFSQEKNNVLSKISGDFRQGELTGIVISPNSRQSILLNILAGFTSSGVTGDIQVDGRPRDLRKFLRSSSYVMRENHLPAKLTVQETMYIAANLKLKMSNFDKHQVINAILKELNMKALRKICTKNLSAYQKKQLILALELISNPPIMFIENPTSDLDNTASLQIMSQLKSLAREGRTIVCTIEKPSAKILATIDHLYVIGNGCCLYAGSPRNLVPFLEDLDLRCPVYHNPSDYLLESINDDHVAKLVASSENGKCEKWRFARNADRTDELNRIDIASKLAPFGSATSCFYEFKHMRTLLEYNLIKLSRDKILTYLRLILNFLMALTLGLLYYGVGQNVVADVIINYKMLFITQTILIFSSFYTALVTFPSELPVLRREYTNHWYKIHSYYLANRLADLPIQVIAAAIYVLTIYFMTGHPLEFQRIRLFLITSVLVSLVGQALGVVVGTSFNRQTATTVGPLLIMSSMLFSGFFIQLHHVHSHLRWIFSLSFCKYGLEEVIAIIYGLNWPALNHNDFSHEFRMPRTIANEFGIEQLNYWFSALTLMGFCVVLHLSAYFSLLARVRRR